MNAHDITNQPVFQGTLEDWAHAYVASDTLRAKLAPPAPPTLRRALREPTQLTKPGRPPELCSTWDKYKAPKSAHALMSTKRRAHLLHTFFHHELQAAELFCWAVLAFPDVPDAFARGLVAICLDEVRHMNMYREALLRLGYDVGSFPVRDWFWERAPRAPTARAFLALMGLGFEAGNLDHSQRFEHMFLAAGDAQSAELMRTVGEEEVQHVAFAAHWFSKLGDHAGEQLEFDAWCRELPAPLSPMLMRGLPLARERRQRAGLSATFVDRLEAWKPASLGV